MSRRPLGPDCWHPDRVGDESMPDFEIGGALFEIQRIRVEDVVGAGEGLRTLTVVCRTRLGITGLELQTAGEAAVELEYQTVVVRFHHVRNGGNPAEVGV